MSNTVCFLSVQFYLFVLSPAFKVCQIYFKLTGLAMASPVRWYTLATKIFFIIKQNTFTIV